jgi:thioredoxin-dependent peroxiredoxin
MPRLEAGDPAPEFSLATDEGGTVSSHDLAGRRYVLYFYPKDDTPGCTKQACGLRDSFHRVIATEVEVFGVSPDSVKSHAKFRDKFALPYRLLADDGHRLAEAYGVWIEKNAMGRIYFGNERTTFVVGPDGRIEHVLARVKPDEHVDQLLGALAEAA